MRDKKVSNKVIECAKDIFRTHREAYPEKRNLLVHFRPGWQFQDHNRMPPPALQSRALIEFEKSKMELYRAILYPRRWKAEECPSFYNDCTGIDLSRLQGFQDNDDGRFSTGGGPSQEHFLRQCTSLHSLALTVDSPLQPS